MTDKDDFTAPAGDEIDQIARTYKPRPPRRGPKPPPLAPLPPGKKVVRKLDFSDPRIEAQIELAAEDHETGIRRIVILQDHGGNQSVAGLQVRIGPRSATWIFYRDVLDHGKRKITSKNLGSFPAMDTAAARQKASIEAGKIGAGRFEPPQSKARKFGDAFREYLDYLQAKADDESKPARWKRNVEALGRIMLPEWEKWPLLEMSKRREDVAEWYKGVVKSNGVTSANHCARVIRAIYIKAARKDDSLPGDPTKYPTAAIDFRREQWQRKGGKDKPGLAFADFPTWRAACDKLAPMHRAYHWTGLLTGARPGELARTRWADLDLRGRTLVIGGAKAGNDIPIPLSVPIIRALKLARDSKPERMHKQFAGLIFPGCEQAARDDLPASGHALRRTWKTVAAALEVPDDLSALMLGHVPEGVSQKYVLRRMLTESRTMRRKQREISARIMALLSGKKYPRP
jgi:integrase